MPHYPPPFPNTPLPVLWCHPPSSHSPAKGSRTPTLGTEESLPLPPMTGIPTEFRKARMGQSPGDSKVRFLLGAEGGRLRTSKVPGKRAASHARGAGSMVGEGGGQARSHLGAALWIAD